MIVDKSGNIFDDRRKKEDRRKIDVKVTNEKRKGDRREEKNKPKKRQIKNVGIMKNLHFLY